MRLDELLPEMLETICDYLCLRDRLALGATCHRMEELAMQPRFLKTVTLRLNKVTNLNEYGFLKLKNDVIPKDIVEGSSRDYKNVKIELCTELELDWVRELLEVFEARQTPVKHLEIMDNNCLQIMRLYQTCQSAFNQIETLDVRQWGRIRGSIRGRRHLVLPELRRLFWHESPDFEEAMHPLANMDIALSAPLLEHAIISMPTTWDDIVSLTGQYYMPHLHLTNHPKLRSLALFVDEHTVRTLSRTLHPTLENLTIRFPPLDLDGSYWFGLVRSVPNLRTLELVARKRTSPIVMILIFLNDNVSIRTLTLQDCILEKTVLVPNEFNSIHHLHIHECEVQLQNSSVIMELPALKTFCVRANVAQTVHTLQLHLPNVREMTLFYRGRMVDVLSAPRLQELRLHDTCRPSLPFLDFPLLYLHTLVLQTDYGWSMLKELLTVNAPALRHLTIICHVPPCLDEMLCHIEKEFPQLETLTISGL